MVQVLKFKQQVNVPAAEVYRAFTNSMVLREWFCNAAQTDPRKGGRIYLWWNSGYTTNGEFTALVPAKKIVFTWRGHDEPGTTRVQITLAEKNGGTSIALTHAGLGTGKVWAKTAKEFERGWHVAMENLKSILETGLDLRFIRRPMLGVFLGVFNAEEAAKLSVPVAEGLRLDGVAPGLGAEKAGLQKDDVIVKMGGKKTTKYVHLANILQAHSAGDRIPVVFYRGSEKKTVTMELSRRPLPAVPATAKELSEAVSQLDEKLYAELTNAFQGVTENQASFKPMPQEWSAKEIIAHLIACERDNHSTLSELILGAERAFDTFDNLDNVHARTTATVQVFATIPELLAELKRNMAESVAMVAAMPDSFVAHKGTYWRVGGQLLQAGEHTRPHIQEICARIEAARQAGA